MLLGDSGGGGHCSRREAWEAGGDLWPGSATGATNYYTLQRRGGDGAGEERVDDMAAGPKLLTAPAASPLTVPYYKSFVSRRCPLDGR